VTPLRDVRAARSGIGTPVYEAGFVAAVPVALDEIRVERGLVPAGCWGFGAVHDDPRRCRHGSRRGRLAAEFLRARDQRGRRYERARAHRRRPAATPCPDVLPCPHGRGRLAAVAGQEAHAVDALRPARPADRPRHGPGPEREAAPDQAAEPGAAVWDLAVVSGVVVPDLAVVAEPVVPGLAMVAGPVVRLSVRKTRASP